MEFKGCPRCNGDLRAEEDFVLRVEDLVCLQCGHRQAVQTGMAGRSIEEIMAPMARRQTKVPA